MGQAEILGLLEENPNKRFDSSEIRARIGTSKGATVTALKALRNTDMVHYAEVRCGNGHKYAYWARG